MLKPCRSIARRALAVLVCGLAGLALLATSTTSFAQGQDLNRNLFNVWHNRNAQSPAECFSVMSIWGQPAYPRTGYPTANWFLIHGSVTWAQAWARVEESLTQMAARRSGCGFGGSRQRHAAAVGVANEIINDIRRDREQAGGQAVARGGGGRSGGPIPADGAQAAGEEPGVPHDGPLSGDVGADFRPGQLSAGAVERGGATAPRAGDDRASVTATPDDFMPADQAAASAEPGSFVLSEVKFKRRNPGRFESPRVKARLGNLLPAEEVVSPGQRQFRLTASYEEFYDMNLDLDVDVPEVLPPGNNKYPIRAVARSNWQFQSHKKDNLLRLVLHGCKPPAREVMKPLAGGSYAVVAEISCETYPGKGPKRRSFSFTTVSTLNGFGSSTGTMDVQFIYDQVE